VVAYYFEECRERYCQNYQSITLELPFETKALHEDRLRSRVDSRNVASYVSTAEAASTLEGASASGPAEHVAQFDVRFVELGLACSGCQAQAAADFAMSEAIDIMQQHNTSFRF
jgi:hypothetical protein